MEAVLNQRETRTQPWGAAALEQRRERTRNHLARIAPRRESWINRNTILLRAAQSASPFFGGTTQKGPLCSLRHGQSFGRRPASARAKALISALRLSAIAQQRNPSFEFAVAFPDKEEFQQAFEPDEKFDYILFNDIGDTVDVLEALRNLKPLCQRHTRLLITTYNHLWEPLVSFAEWVGMKVPRTEQNWLSIADVRNLLRLAGFEALETHRIVLLPKYIPLLSGFLNRFCARLPFLSKLCMTQVVVARMLPPPISPGELSRIGCNSMQEREGKCRGGRSTHSGVGSQNRDHFL